MGSAGGWEVSPNNHKLFGSLLEDREKPWDGFRRDGGSHGSGSRLRLSSGQCVALGGAGRQLLGCQGELTLRGPGEWP